MRARPAVAIVVLSLALGAGDIVTTSVGLNMGFREANPIARSMLESYGIMGLVGLKAILMSLSLGLAVAIKQRAIGLCLWALAFGTVHVYAIHNNLSLIF